jgi:hypothetical protein
MEGTLFILTPLEFRRMKRLIILLLYGFSLSISLVNAQSTNATLSGGVTDPAGTFIVGAEIDIANDTTGVIYSAKTNSSGIYYLSVLPPGHYHVQVSKIGFKTLIKPDVVLNVQSALSLNFSLPVGATSESITVDAGASSINTSEASVSTVVDRKFVENMPLNGRSFQDLISMTPGVVTQSPQTRGAVQSMGDFSVNGQRTESNYYTVDGVSANTGAGAPTGYGQVGTSGSVAGSTALGTTQSLVSVDALQEFRVSSSTYSAEYGRSPGGQFSLSTRSGTNRFGGTAFDYLRNDIFDANDWFNNHNGIARTALRQNDFGGTLGGPIILPRLYRGIDHSFFFFSYEGLRLVQPVAATTQYVPSLGVRSASATAIQPIFNAFPVPTGSEIEINGSPSGLSPFVSAYSLPSQIDSTSIRLDHSITSRMSVFFRLANTPSYAQARNLSAVSDTDVNSRTYTAGVTNQFSGRRSNEFRFGYVSSSSSINEYLDGFGGATPIDMSATMGVPGATKFTDFYPYITITGVGYSTIEQTKSASHLRQWNLTDTASLTFGRHQLRVGVDERRIHSPLTPSSPYGGVDYYDRDSMIQNVAGDGAIAKVVSSEPIFQEFAAFAQDDWRLSHSVSLALGLRWEVNPPPTEAHGQAAYTVLGDVSVPSSLTLAPRGTPLWRTTFFNFAPRLGIAWTARSHSGQETVFRAGGGVFYDTGNQIAALGFSGAGFLGLDYYYNVTLPFAPSQFDISTAATPPYTSGIYAFPSHLQLPYSLQWNASVEQALGKSQTMSVSYVASSGRRLLQEQRHVVSALNPNFSTILYFPDGVTSNYQSLQVKFQRGISRGLQALASYTWSHSLDFGSTNSAYPLTRGNSDFDLRHNFEGGLSWELPHPTANPFMRQALGGWGLDGRAMARTAFPITLLGSLRTDATGNRYYSGVNYDASKPVYIYSNQYPGGRALNGGILQSNPAFTLPSVTASGNAPRNFVRGFNAVQFNAALRRDFPIGGRLHLQFRAETFNLLNRANFGYVDPTLSDGQFGQATKTLDQSLVSMSSLYQQGGPRSMQFALKILF